MEIITFTIVRNMESTICLMIESINWVDKIIIYDDNSSDKTVQRIKSFQSTNKYANKIILLKSLKKESIFDIGEKKERNRLIKFVFKNYKFDYLILIDGDELISKRLKKHLAHFDDSKYLNLAFSCYHIYNSSYYLHFYENLWNGVKLIDPHIRVLTKLKYYETGAWGDMKHPWLKYTSETKCINEMVHFHLKYFENSVFLNTSLAFLPQQVTYDNAKQYMRKIPSKLPSDILKILNKYNYAFF